MEEKVFERGQVVTILTDQPVNGGLLDYIVSQNSVQLGQFVEVPIGKRDHVGVVWSNGSAKIDRVKLRYINRSLDAPSMSNELKKFLIVVASYTVNPMSKVFKLLLGGIEFCWVGLNFCIKDFFFGLSKKKAINQFEKSGFKLGKLYYKQNEDLIPYTVLDQSIKPGTILEKPSAIDLTISVLDMQDIFNNIIE